MTADLTGPQTDRERVYAARVKHLSSQVAVLEAKLKLVPLAYVIAMVAVVFAIWAWGNR